MAGVQKRRARKFTDTEQTKDADRKETRPMPKSKAKGLQVMFNPATKAAQNAIKSAFDRRKA